MGHTAFAQQHAGQIPSGEVLTPAQTAKTTHHQCCAGVASTMVDKAVSAACAEKSSNKVCRKACCKSASGCCVPLMRCTMGVAGYSGADVAGLCATTASNPELRAARGFNYAHLLLAFVYPLLMAPEAGALRDGTARELLVAYGKIAMSSFGARDHLPRLLGPNVTCQQELVSHEMIQAVCGGDREQVIHVRIPHMAFYNRSYFSRAHAFADLVSSRLRISRVPLAPSAGCMMHDALPAPMRIVVLLRGNNTQPKSLETRQRLIHGLHLACDAQYAAAIRQRTGAQLECASLSAKSTILQNARAIGGERTIALVSGHGAGLANIVFLRPGAALVEIDSVGNKHNDRNMYQLLARAVGVVPTKVWLDHDGRHYPELVSQPVRWRISPKRPGSAGGWLKGSYSASVRIEPTTLESIVRNATARLTCAPP